MSLLERFPAYKVISSVIQNPLGPFKTRVGEGRKGKKKKVTHTADAFMVYNPVCMAYATTGSNTVSPWHADQPTDRTEKPGEEIHPPKPTQLEAKSCLCRRQLSFSSNDLFPSHFADKQVMPRFNRQ